MPLIRIQPETFCLKSSFKPRPAIFVTLLTATFVVATTATRAPQAPQIAAGSRLPPPRTYPAPVNLKVLPKNLTGLEVRDIMKQWAGALGVRCDSCHVEALEQANSAEPPNLNFEDDSKPLKSVARLMYSMTDEINSNYIAKVEGSGMPVTCGTCHRGQMSPEPFTITAPSGPPAAQTPANTEEGPKPQ